MKIESLASHLNLPEQVVHEAGTSLGIAAEQEISSADLKRLQAYLEPNYPVDASKFEALISASVSPTPELPEPSRGGVTTQPSSNSGSPEKEVGRLDLSAFGNLGNSILTRLSRNDLSLKRKTRNCGDTAGMVLGGLRELSQTQTVRDVQKSDVLESLSKPATQHEVWDITVHQHTFTLERYPGGENMLIQSYQPGYNVQHWCGLDEPYLESDALAELPKTWFKPSDDLVAQLATRIGNLYGASQEARSEIWESLPFNPEDALVESAALAFDANHITFESPDSMGASLRGLTKAIDDLS